MQDQVNTRHGREVAAAAKSVFEAIALVSAWFSVTMLFSLAGISMPGVTQIYLWIILFFCLFGFQRIYAGLFWFVVLMLKPHWVGVGAINKDLFTK